MKTKWLAVSLVVISLMLVVACAKPAPAPAPTLSPSPTPSPTVSPTPTAVIQLKYAMPFPGQGAVGRSGQAWIKKLEEGTGGKVKVDFFPGGALGTSKEHYDIAVTGMADIVCTVPGYTPGRFPLFEASNLPFTSPDAITASRTFQKMYETEPALQAEFKDTKFLLVAVGHPRGVLTRTKPVNTLEDMKGLKLRATDEVQAKTMELLGAAPSMIAVGDMYSSIERGIIDGTVLEAAGSMTWKLEEVIKYYTPVRLGQASWVVVMNSAKFNSLPADIQKVILNISGDAGANAMGTVFEQDEVTSLEQKMKPKGIQIIELSAQERQKWLDTVSPQLNDWTAQMEAKGKPGEKVLDNWLKLIAEYK